MTLQKYIQVFEVKERELARKSGISLRSIYRYVNNEVQPTLEKAMILKAVTNGEVDLEDWFHETEEPRPSLQHFRVRFGCR